MWGHMAGIGVDWCEIGCEVMDELDEMSAPERLDAPLSNISAASHNISTEDVDYWRGDWSTGYDDSSVPLSPLSGPRLGHAGVPSLPKGRSTTSASASSRTTPAAETAGQKGPEAEKDKDGGNSGRRGGAAAGAGIAAPVAAAEKSNAARVSSQRTPRNKAAAIALPVAPAKGAVSSSSVRSSSAAAGKNSATTSFTTPAAAAAEVSTQRTKRKAAQMNPESSPSLSSEVHINPSPFSSASAAASPAPAPAEPEVPATSETGRSMRSTRGLKGLLAAQAAASSKQAATAAQAAGSSKRANNTTKPDASSAPPAEKSKGKTKEGVGGKGAGRGGAEEGGGGGGGMSVAEFATTLMSLSGDVSHGHAEGAECAVSMSAASSESYETSESRIGGSSEVGMSSADALLLHKKHRRLIKNRESAQLSRQRKKNHLETLEAQVQALEAEREALAQRMQELVEENERLSKMGPNSSLVDLLYELPSDLQGTRSPPPLSGGGCHGLSLSLPPSAPPSVGAPSAASLWASTPTAANGCNDPHESHPPATRLCESAAAGVCHGRRTQSATEAEGAQDTAAATHSVAGVDGGASGGSLKVVAGVAVEARRTAGQSNAVARPVAEQAAGGGVASTAAPAKVKLLPARSTRGLAPVR